MTKIRVCLADDHAVLRAGLRALLNVEPDIEVVGEAADGREAVEQVKRLEPDVVVMDLAMPGLGGLDATAAIADLGLGTRVLILTMHADQQYVLPALKAGASGYLVKSAADRDLIEAIRTVHQGEVFLQPSAAKVLVEGYRDQSREGALEDGLSERERDVLRLTAEGYSSQEIGERLHLSPKTVETYRLRVMEKLHFRHRSELVRYALRRGLLVSTGE